MNLCYQPNKSLSECDLPCKVSLERMCVSDYTGHLMSSNPILKVRMTATMHYDSSLEVHGHFACKSVFRTLRTFVNSRYAIRVGWLARMHNSSSCMALCDPRVRIYASQVPEL